MEKAKESLINQRGEMIKELIHGIEVANKLQEQLFISTDNNDDIISIDNNVISTDNNDIISIDNQLRDDFAKSSLNRAYISEIYENKRILINKILSCFDKTITMAKLMMVQAQGTTCSVLESPPSQNSHHFSKKRKKNPTEMKRISVEGSALGSEGTLGDGYGWRKYGQKIILGAKFPRAYYRCTHRHTQGCEATKQVQQLDENPSIYEIMYSGEHTCSLWAQMSGAQMSEAQTRPNQAQIIETKLEPAQPTQEPQQEVFLGLGPNGELKVEEFDYQNEAQFFRPFSFASNFLEVGLFDDMLNYSALGLGSSDTDSDCLPMTPIGHCGLNVQLSDSELNDTISGLNSITNSPKVGEFEFPLDPLIDLDFDFPFEF